MSKIRINATRGTSSIIVGLSIVVLALAPAFSVGFMLNGCDNADECRNSMSGEIAHCACYDDPANCDTQLTCAGPSNNNDAAGAVPKDTPCTCPQPASEVDGGACYDDQMCASGSCNSFGRCAGSDPEIVLAALVQLQNGCEASVREYVEPPPPPPVMLVGCYSADECTNLVSGYGGMHCACDSDAIPNNCDTQLTCAGPAAEGACTESDGCVGCTEDGDRITVEGTTQCSWHTEAGECHRTDRTNHCQVGDRRGAIPKGTPCTCPQPAPPVVATEAPHLVCQQLSTVLSQALAMCTPKTVISACDTAKKAKPEAAAACDTGPPVFKDTCHDALDQVVSTACSNPSETFVSSGSSDAVCDAAQKAKSEGAAACNLNPAYRDMCLQSLDAAVNLACRRRRQRGVCDAAQKAKSGSAAACDMDPANKYNCLQMLDNAVSLACSNPSETVGGVSSSHSACDAAKMVKSGGAAACDMDPANKYKCLQMLDNAVSLACSNPKVTPPPGPPASQNALCTMMATVANNAAIGSTLEAFGIDLSTFSGSDGKIPTQSGGAISAAAQLLAVTIAVAVALVW